MSKHCSGPFQYLTCKICKTKKYILHTFDLKVSDVDFDFISIDIDLSILKIDSKNMLRCIL